MNRNHIFFIFEPNRRFFTKSSLSWLAFFFMLLWSFEYPKGRIAWIVALLFLGFYFRSFQNMYRTQKPDGKLNGYLIFQPDGVSIKNRWVSVGEIQKVFISAHDYYGRERALPGPVSFPLHSNGTNNTLRLELRNGEILIAMFQIENQQQQYALFPFLAALINHNLLTFEKVVDQLRLDSVDANNYKNTLMGNPSVTP
jgi:hypothetical protein